ncbi:MAG: hypothetical protein II263_00875 [Lachnospiraceae bacterium]|nr:hypothetical protein [Lachnospiraceae bacterium]
MREFLEKLVEMADELDMVDELETKVDQWNIEVTSMTYTTPKKRVITLSYEYEEDRE